MRSVPLTSAPLKSLTLAQKLCLPVSTVRDANGESVVVSHYDEPVWDFWPYIHHENRAASNKAVDWRMQMPDGSLLTDQRYKQLLESAKDFLWSLYAEPIEGLKRPSMTTLIHRATEMAPLLRWMVSKGLRRFADLEGHTLAFIPFARKGQRGSGLPAAATVRLRLSVVEAIYRQRGKLNDALCVHPWPGETSHTLSDEATPTGRKPKTELIPEPVVNTLARAALEYVLVRGERLLSARTALVEVGAREEGRHAVHASIARKNHARKLGFTGQEDFSSQLITMRTACYITIDLFSGIRDSEMMSLSKGCTVPGKTLDGIDVLWLHGTLYKTGERKKRWLVPPIVGQAVDILTRLSEPLRDKLAVEYAHLVDAVEEGSAAARKKHLKRLAIVRRQKDKLFLGQGARGGGAVQVLAGGTMSDYLKAFCRDHGVVGADGLPYDLNSHQFRRTYAHFVARAELGDLLMLREHFGHWTLDMSLLYADGGADEYEGDTELMEFIAEEKQARQREIIAEVVDSELPLGSAGDWLKSWRQEVRTAPNKEALVAEFSDSITLNGTGHSWCAGNAKGAGCGGLCVFEADMCVDCNFGVITHEHRPVWEGIRDQQREALTMNDLGVSGQARAKAILLKAEKVLRRLDGGSVE